MISTLKLLLLLCVCCLCRGWRVPVAHKFQRSLFYPHQNTRPLSPRLDSLLTEANAPMQNTENNTPQRKPIGSAPDFAIDNDSTEVTPVQSFLVLSHFLLFFSSLGLAGSALPLNSYPDIFWAVFSVVLSIVVGDFATGVFHWSVDNYGSLQTPIVGSVCAAFQGHHQSPWTITFRPFANNVYKIAKATIPALALTMLAPIGVYSKLFLTLFINWWLLSQEFHKFSHMKKVPAWVRWLQDRNIILSRKEHGQHHNSPYEANYCILTGICNPVLDKTLFFRHLEKAVFRLTGNRPLTWGDEEMERLAMSSTLFS